MELKKIACEVCGEEFCPDKKNTYTAEEPRTDAGFIFLPRKYFSATDCPRCGCQIRLAPRAPRVTLPEYEPEPEDQEESGAEE